MNVVGHTADAYYTASLLPYHADHIAVQLSLMLYRDSPDAVLRADYNVVNKFGVAHIFV